MSPNEGGSGASTPLYVDFCLSLLGWSSIAQIAAHKPAGNSSAPKAVGGASSSACDRSRAGKASSSPSPSSATAAVGTPTSSLKVRVRSKSPKAAARGASDGDASDGNASDGGASLAPTAVPAETSSRGWLPAVAQGPEHFDAIAAWATDAVLADSDDGDVSRTALEVWSILVA